MDNEDLLVAYVGNNYDKIKNNKFNFCGLFFNIFYLFYRKLFLYAVIVVLLYDVLLIVNVGLASLYLMLLFILLVIFFNRVYLSVCKRRIIKIKEKNSEKTYEEIRNICVSKGGTSYIYVFLGILVIFPINFVVSIYAFTKFINGFLEKFDMSMPSIIELFNEYGYGTISNVKISGITEFNDEWGVFVKYNGIEDIYYTDSKTSEILYMLADYEDYVSISLSYTQNGNKKFITSFMISIKQNGKNISNIKSEEELRKILGLE